MTPFFKQLPLASTEMSSLRLAFMRKCRLLLGFVLSPPLPCLLLADRSTPNYALVTGVALLVSYSMILILAFPAFYVLSKRIKVGVLHCVSAGFAIGCFVPFFCVFVLHFNGGRLETMTLLKSGALGASIGFLFWVFALLPIPRSPKN